MLAKLGLAEIEAPSPYLAKATGPKKGAKLLFENDLKSKTKIKTLDENVVLLGKHLGVSMQVMEDSICNWQKSPAKYLAFHG